MHIKMNLTANFTADDVMEIVKEYINKQGFNVESLTVKINKKSSGYAMQEQEHDEFFFDGIEAKITQASDSNDCFLIKNKEIL